MSRLNSKYSASHLRTWLFYVVSALLLCLLLSTAQVKAAQSQPAADPITDLRILVDVSGSMKKNDPKNLRRDALRLLIGMLPETSRVGIWSFGQYVNMQVKPDFATKAWKNNARKEANTIHSRGLYTNIQDTLTKSSWDWRRPDPKWDRHMILLTDGMVDISKDPSKNKNSRSKILGSIVSELSAANVKIHTIALSQQADHELLKKLSKKTGGWYESVDSADMLQRLFLKLFEKTTKMDSLPLEDNLFDVDDSITDMTLLVFRSRSGEKTKVIMPDHTVLEYSKSVKGVEWFQDKSFDIITVRKPMPGKWKLDADIDKDNRVKIISNLKLKVSPLPIDIIENETVKIEASIYTKEGLLSDKNVLKLVTVETSTTGYAGKEVIQNLQASSEAGKFESILDGLGEKGTAQVVVKVISPTFKREARYEIKVHENPVKLKLLATKNGLVISVTENPLLLQTGTLQLALRIEGKKGAYYVTKFGAHHWQATLDNSFEGKSITINATANRIGNKAFKSQLHGRLPEAIKPAKDPLTIWSEETDSGLVVKVMLEENILQTGTLQLNYYDENSKDNSTSISQHTDNIWQQLLLPEHTGKSLTVSAVGHQLNGEAFKKEYTVIIPELKIKEVVEEVVVEEHAKEEEHQKELETDDSSGHGASDDEHAAEPEETNSLVVIIALVISNIIIFVGAYFGYRYWKKKNKPLSDDFDEDEAKGDSEELKDSKSKDDSAVEPEEVTDKGAEDKSEKQEDFASQRKDPSDAEPVELDEPESEGEPEKQDEKVEETELLETSSADDLPDFEVDMESDVTDEGEQEKDK